MICGKDIIGFIAKTSDDKTYTTMNIFKNLNLTQKKEKLIKENILNVLHNNAKEIQYEFSIKGTGDLEDARGIFCETIEAIFLHGLKDSFLSQTLNAVSISDDECKPEPSFWSPLLIFLHKQDIEQIQGLTQITSEIGCCRSWIRVSLNQSCMSSYLNNIKQNCSSLDPYYKKYAILRDCDSMDIAVKIIESVEDVCQFDFPVNSSLYNMWSNNSLQLSGLWTPPLKSCPIYNGYDVASSISNEIPVMTPEPVRKDEVFSESISSSPFKNLELFYNRSEENTLDEEPEIEEDIEKTQSPTLNIESNSDLVMGNSLSSLLTSSTWSSNTACNENSILEPQKSIQRTNSCTNSISRRSTHRSSYNAILKKHETERVIDWTDVWTKFKSLEIQNNEVNNEDEFEIVSDPHNKILTLENIQNMVKMTCELGIEKGLDIQGFLCDDCGHPIGMDFSDQKKCAFSGKYMCYSCMSMENCLIPAKVIYNWDFKRYAISKKYQLFLKKYNLQPFLNFKVLNPNIYRFSKIMANIQSLRIKLNFIRAYLCTCCSESINTFKEIVGSKEYLYEHIHEYSIEDLEMIENGTLQSILQKACIFGENHILSCKLCKLKGFYCEICRSSNLLYPFHLDTTFHCKGCGAVFHDVCLNSSAPCPKCERLRMRS